MHDERLSLSTVVYLIPYTCFVVALQLVFVAYTRIYILNARIIVV